MTIDFLRVCRMALVVAGSLSVAKQSAEGQRLATDDVLLEKIWTEARNNSQFMSLSQVLLDSLGPRLTGSSGMERAQDWAVKKLESWGVEAVAETYGTWEGWDRGISHVDLVAPRIRSLEGRILAWSPGTEGKALEGLAVGLPLIRSEEDWSDFLGTVRGKWVMMSFPEPTCRASEQWVEYALPRSLEEMTNQTAVARDTWARNIRATGSTDPRLRDLHDALEQAGSLGIITSQWPGSYGTTRVFNAYNRSSPTFELSCEDYGLVYRLAEEGQDPLLRLTAESENRGEVPVSNVIGRITGTELPDEYVMLSAHYDSWDGGSGATDNGSGSILMLETMRILSAIYPKPKRTILIGLWNGEEQGLNGSRAFTEDHPEVVEGLQALFNQDNGTGRIVNISSQGFTEAVGSLAQWLSKAPGEVTGHVRMDVPGSPGGGGSDYASFVCHGAPAFNLGALSWDYGSHTWHTHRDTFDKLVFDDLINNAVLAASLVYLASEDTERVSRKKRTVIVGQDGSPSQWPVCTPATRTSRNSSRM
ncbi:MAG: M20/M25/M40 family metallo-hydrolase [bacterium]